MMDSLWNVMEYERENYDLLYKRFPVYSGPISLDRSRNIQAKVFLDDTDCDWLWLIDSDMGFKPDTLTLLVSSADPETRPVVCGLFNGLNVVGQDGMGGEFVEPYPIVFGFSKTPTESGIFEKIPKEKLPIDSLIRIGGTGAACILIHRSVLEKIREAEGDNWFTYLHYSNGEMISEDLSFCIRLSRINAPLFINTMIKVSHHKSVWIGQE